MVIIGEQNHRSKNLSACMKWIKELLNICLSKENGGEGEGAGGGGGGGGRGGGGGGGGGDMSKGQCLKFIT